MTFSAPAVAGIVLAAGSGVRFGQPKAPVVIDGERLVDRQVRLLRESDIQPIVVVLGAWVGEVPGAQVVVNPDYATGMGSSLARALDYFLQDSVQSPEPPDALLVTLVDLPGLTTEALTAISESSGELVQATYSGKRGHPVKIGRRHWQPLREHLRNGHRDQGARDYLAANTVQLTDVGHLASGSDLDYDPTT